MIKDIVAREEYEVNGEKKVSWNQIGILIDKGDKQYIKLNQSPGIVFFVYEQKKKDGDQTGSDF